MNVTVESVKQTIQGLPKVDRDALIDWIRKNEPETDCEPNFDPDELELLGRLKNAGIIDEIAVPMSDKEDDEYPPIIIGGEPMSEMILRERR